MRDHRGLLSRAEGCWTFDARDRMPRSSRLLVHPITAAAENPPTTTRTPSRESGLVLRPEAVVRRSRPTRPVMPPFQSFPPARRNGSNGRYSDTFVRERRPLEIEVVPIA